MKVVYKKAEANTCVWLVAFFMIYFPTFFCKDCFNDFDLQSAMFKPAEFTTKSDNEPSIDLEWLDDNPRLGADCHGTPIIAHIPRFMNQQQLVS